MATANNPFDLNTVSGKQLASSAASAVTAPNTTGYNAATAGASGYDASTANASGYDASTMTGQGYNAAQALGTNWTVDNPQTVQGQVSGIIAANSPLVQQARAASLAQMNARGLTNSSMALGEGQKAVISSAMPIATQDASLYANNAKYNADTANNMSQFNVGQQNTGLQFTANAGNTAAASNQQAANQAMQFNSGSLNQAALSNAQSQNQAMQFTAGSANQAALTNAASQNQAAQFTAGSQNEASGQYATALNSTVQKMMDQSMQYAMSNADATTKIELQNIDAQTRKDLAATEATYKNQMQASQSANDVFQQVSKNISDIMANPDLYSFATTDGAAPKTDGSNLQPGTSVTNGIVVDATGKAVKSPKQAAVDMQKAYLTNSMDILSATSGIKLADGKTLSSLLKFD